MINDLINHYTNGEFYDIWIDSIERFNEQHKFTRQDQDRNKPKRTRRFNGKHNQIIGEYERYNEYTNENKSKHEL